MSSIATHDLVGSHEIAQRCGVARSTVYMWMTRYDDFPDAVATLMMGRVWSWPHIRRWLDATGRNHHGFPAS